MEPHFDRDFSDVRVHADAKAAESATSVNALAYTAGRDVVFGSGQYQPHSDSGKRLIAHELTHVVQQHGRTIGGHPLALERSDTQHERVAEAASDLIGSVVAGPIQATDSAAIQRQVAKPPAEQGAAAPETASRPSRAEAATMRLRRLHEQYKSNPNNKESYHTSVVTILQFLQETVTDGRMTKAFVSLDLIEQRSARDNCETALGHVRRLEAALRTGYPRPDDERTWQSPIGAMDMAQRYVDRILNYREPVPLSPGWHKVIDETGVIVGYLHLLGGVTKIFNADGKFVGGDELGLERPLIDPIDIFSGGIVGIVRGSLRGVLSGLIRRGAPRAGVAAILVAQGLKNSIPGLAGEVAPSAFVAAETLATESVPAVLRGVSTTVAKDAASQAGHAQAASAIVSTATKAATSASSQGATAAASVGAVSAASPVAQSVAGATGATAASNLSTQQTDPRHARGYAGEQTAGFHHYSQKDGWEFIQGPSGSQGHSVTGSGFDGMAYNQELDLLDLIDNKSLGRPGNVNSATAIDPAKNLGQNLDDAITQLTGMSDVRNRIRILQLLRAKRAALTAGTSGPPNVRLVVTHQGGQTTGVSGPLSGRGIISR
jgi:hypothetical protein